MNPRNRRQTVTTVFDGRTHHVALCRGEQDGLPVFGWGEAPSTLLTRSQLRAVGLRPNGQDPVALLVFRHVKPYARETTAELFSVELAAAYRPPTPAAADRAGPRDGSPPDLRRLRRDPGLLRADQHPAVLDLLRPGPGRPDGGGRVSSNDSGAWHRELQRQQEEIERQRREAASKEGSR